MTRARVTRSPARTRRHGTTRPALFTAALAASLILAACGAAGDGEANDGTDNSTEEAADDGATQAGEDGSRTEDAGMDTDELGGDLTVFAAASLNGVFEDIAVLFTAEHPDVTVMFSFAGSSELVAQLDAGAPADVLATANEATMAAAANNGTIEGEPELFATNVLTLITPAGNPAGVTGLNKSLDGADLVVCAPQVPCGTATTSLSALLDVELQPVSEENSVTDVLGKIISGQGDAGLVYTTDAASAGDQVEIIEVFDQDEEVINYYPIAVTTGSDQPDLASAWVDFVQGSQAQQVLGEAGFGTP